MKQTPPIPDAVSTAFLAAIIANPKDDLTRLVFADWLDEHDESERAEFIRVQCEADRIKGGGCAVVLLSACDGTKEWCIRCGLISRSRELLGLHWPNWAGRVLSRYHCDDLWKAKPTPTPSIAFRRGFVAEITCTAEDWERYGDSLTWCWGECGRCEKGEIGLHFDPSSGEMRGGRTCPTCSGSGRVPPTMACPGCKGKAHYRWINEDGVTEEDECGLCCDNAIPGRVPRPCPPTAQPIEVVRLTNAANLADWGVAKVYPEDGSSTVICEFAAYPGIRFHVRGGSRFTMAAVERR